MQTYQIVLLILVLIVFVSGLVFYFTKSKEGNVEEKDKNLKIAVKLINKEDYEETGQTQGKDDVDTRPIEETGQGSSQFFDDGRCRKMLSLFGDPINNGLLDMYKDITGKDQILPVKCNKDTENNFTSIMLNMINEMVFKAIENPDKEKGYNDLVALYLIILNKLGGSDDDKINVSYNSKGDIETIELIHYKIPITQAKMIENVNNIPEHEPEGRTLEITDILKKTKERAKNTVKTSDLDNLKGNNNSKIKVYDFGIILSNIIAKQGSLIR